MTFLRWMAQGLGLGIGTCALLSVVCLVTGNGPMAWGFLFSLVVGTALLLVVAAVAATLVQLRGRRHSSA